jgi:1-phosphatidylinositol phosphodiesterase
MATPPLTIRNLTTTTLELKLVERFDAPKTNDGSGISNITRNFTGLMGKGSASPTSPQLALHSESFSHQDVSIPVGPFEIKTTDIQTAGEGHNEILRLTFESEGQKYRIDTPTPSQRSTVFTPLSPGAKHEYTGVYLPESSFLAIYSSANLESWMSQLKDESPLSALSMPGTHNSPTCHVALPSVRCQAVNVRDQLNNGVRFLDIRVQPENPSDPSKDGLILVHSAFPISLTGNKYFRDLVNDVEAFLDRNPTETVIMSLKREGVGKATDQQLSKILRDHYAGDVNHWFTAPRIPTLGEARKKIVLIRRFVLDDSLHKEWDGAGWCIDAESWPDNCEDGTCSGGDIRVQDFYEVGETENIGKKIEFSQNQLERSAACICPLPRDLNTQGGGPPKQPFFINFLSASNFWKAGCWPDRIAAKVNPSIIDWLCRKHNEAAGIGKADAGDGSTGIVVCDWVGNNGDWDLVRCIVGMNAKLELRENQ